MRYPILSGKTPRRKSISVFTGYDHRLRAAEGSFYETENMSVEGYPMLSARKKRGEVLTLTSPQGLIEKDALAWVDNGTLYYNSLATPVTGLTAGEKQLVSMGAYLCIFPDNRYFNTADHSDYGSMDAHWSYTGSVSYAMCDAEGEAYSGVDYSLTEPTAPENGQLWLDGENSTLARWSDALEQWVNIESVYTKLTFTTQGQLPSAFSQYDGIELSGSSAAGLNGSRIIQAVGGGDGVSDYIVVLNEPVTGGTYQNESIRIDRRVPAMDFVCQCRNRLWGCRYGNDGNGNLNELYACALGDFKNWNQFMGLSTDSWRASVGSDGAWTGAVNYLGSPIFFKENCLHRVGVSSVGAHQVEETVCRGVEKGSAKSLAVVNETLYYKSISDVCAYQGSFPESISAPLGDKHYSSAVAGVLGRRYYLSVLDSDSTPHLFVYDTQKGLWCREDSFRAFQFASKDNELYCISGNKLIGMTGKDGTAEDEISWSAETGLSGLEYPREKYVSRLILRADLQKDGETEVFVCYDSLDRWEYAGGLRQNGTGSVEIPLKLRRCDHFRIRISGTGDVKLYAIWMELTEG
ncbi:MAG: hypothetical protein Q4E35_04170 [Eubacteriales bacterium]|nr:hypothetical protein [Eubacteriales bacterium]